MIAVFENDTILTIGDLGLGTVFRRPPPGHTAGGKKLPHSSDAQDYRRPYNSPSRHEASFIRNRVPLGEVMASYYSCRHVISVYTSRTAPTTVVPPSFRSSFNVGW